MSNPNTPYCPLTFVLPEDEHLQCQQGYCAWWHKVSGTCAILTLPKVLAHHLANIANNTAKIGG